MRRRALGSRRELTAATGWRRRDARRRLRFSSPARAHCAHSRLSARQRANARRRRRWPPDGLARAGFAGFFDAAATRLSSMIREVIAARLEGVRVRGDAVASIEATLIERVDDCRWRALARPAKRLKVGERIRFGESSESMACLLAALDAEVEEKGEAGEASAALRLRRRGAGRSDRATRRPPFAALHRLSPRRNRERSHGLSDDVRGKTRRGGGADGGAAFHAGAGCSP